MDVFKTLILDTPTLEGATGTVTSVDLTAGTGISVSGGPITSSGSITVTNSAPDQTVSIASGTGISVTGSYPSFTVTNSSPSLGGDVVGPASATDNAVVRFDSTTGKLIQDSGVSISDANLLTTTALTVNDNTTLGSSNSDTVTFNARSASEFTPATDNTYDLGRTGHEWRDLYIDGTANIDSLVADTADINGGTIDGTAIGATTPSTGAFTTGSFTDTSPIKLTLNGGTNQNGIQLETSNTIDTHAFYIAAGNDLIFGADKGFAILDATSGYAGRFFIDAATGLTSIYAGLDVTGALSSTVADAAVGARIAGATGRFYFQPYFDATEGQRLFSLNTAESGYQPLSLIGSTVRISPNASLVGLFSSTGLDVTGEITATGTANLNNGISIVTANGVRNAIYSLQTSNSEWGIGQLASNNTFFITNRTGSQDLGYAPQSIQISSSGVVTVPSLVVTGALSKGSGSFRIEHPLPSKSATHELVHSFIEGPKCDLIYRGKIDLVDGKATVNIDTDSTMTEGTFEALCATVQCFTSNESGWGAIRGKVVGNILTIEAQDAASTDSVSWMVIGERKDKHIIDTDWTDENGRPIVEPLKPVVESK